MAENEKKDIAKMLTDYDWKYRYMELKRLFPSGYMTKRQISEYFGYHNNSRWGTSFVKPMTAYKVPGSTLRKYKIPDVLARYADYQAWIEEGAEDAKETD